MTLDEAILSIDKKWNRLDEAVTKAKDARLAVAMELRALKERIENGENGDICAIDWWGWYESKFRRSRSEAEKLLAIAGADDPPAALERVREQSNARKKTYRERLKVAGGNGPALRSGTQADAPKPRAASVDLTNAPMLRPINETPPPELSDAEKQTVDQICDLFESLSWHGRRVTNTRLTALYKKWHG
jgi:hypothetical protein